MQKDDRADMDEERSLEERIASRNLRGQDLDKVGKTQEAIKLYELNVANGADTPFPYDRLAIIYRKQKRLDEEVRILQRATVVFGKFGANVGEWQ